MTASEARRATYTQLLKEERAKIVPSGSGIGPGRFITGGQISAAKARATKRFNALDREGHFA